MPEEGKKEVRTNPSNPFNKIAIWAVLAWTVVIGVSAIWNVYLVRKSILQMARVEAASNLNKDMIYRLWVAGHGGVYAPASKGNPPNPLLVDVPERDVVTPSGRRLTLINPAYMTRQVHELGNRLYGVKAHITSLDPLRPQNAPDNWENKLLRRMSTGSAGEFSEVVTVNGLSHLRMMRPLFAEKSCLACHGSQGYQEGDLRGGLSVSVPLKPYQQVAGASLQGITIGHGFIWVLGLCVAGFMWSVNRNRFDEKMKAEEALKESEQRLADVVNFLPDATVAIDEERKVIVWNKAMEEMTGIPAEEMLGRGDHVYMIPFYGERRKNLLDLVWDQDPELEKAYIYVRREGDSIISETFVQRLRKGKGAHLFLKVAPLHDKNGRVTGAIESIRDITEFKQAEENRLHLERQVLKSQKLESLGVLAGGIAHDFNNILTAIMGYAGLAMMKLSPASPVQPCIEEIEKAAHRAAELCRQMLNYSGKGRFILESIDAGNLIREMEHLLKASIPKKVALTLNLEENLPVILGDASQIRQIVLNLVINASEAIGDGSGEIKVSTGVRDCTHGYLADMSLSEGLHEGLYVWIEVSDTGCGMDKQTAARIFEPFFTTKFTGRGLGLAAVQGIVRGHKGALRVESESGRGTIFRILLPAAEQENGGSGMDAKTPLDAWRGTGTVLLVDDDPTVREMGRQMIELIGFKAVTAGDGCEALEEYRKAGSGIDIVVLDTSMPCMDGVEALTELRAVNPDVRVVISSGYTETDIASRFSGTAPSAFIQKPFSLNGLRDCLRMVLKQ